MRRRMTIGLLSVLGLAVLGIASMGDRAVPITAAPVSAQTLQAGVAVNGEGKAVVQPDMASVNLGVMARAATARDAMAQAGAAMNKVLERVKAVGIPDQDLQTTDISLYPHHDRDGRVTGYEARTTVHVTVRDISKAVWVLDGAVEAGANQTFGISFGLRDPEALRLKALQDAIRAARARADTIAASLGVRIVGVRSVSDGFGGVPVPVRGAPEAAPAAGAPVPVERGQLTVYERVFVVYDIAQ